MTSDLSLLRDFVVLLIWLSFSRISIISCGLVGPMMNASFPKRNLDHYQHPERFLGERNVDDSQWNAIQKCSPSRRKLEQQREQSWGVPWEEVDDDEWNAIQSVFAALNSERPQRQNSSPTISSATSIATSPSMVPSILPSSPAAALFYHNPFCPGHSVESFIASTVQCQSDLGFKSSNGGHSPSVSRQGSTPERWKQKDNSFWTGISHGSSNGQGASPWKMGTRLLPCQFPPRTNCLGGGGTGPELQSNDSTSVESGSRPLESQEHRILPPEMGVGPRTSREEPFPQFSEMVPPTAEDGSRESSKTHSRRTLPAWIEPAGRFLLAVEKARSVGQSRYVPGLEVVINSETVDEEQIRRPNGEQLGDVASAPQQTENGRPAWVQLEQPQIGLPWGLQPSSCVDGIKPRFPTMQFRGQIVYSKTESEVNAATDELWRRVRELQETTRGAVPIGFDLEWRPTFGKGEIPRKTAVLQLCLDGRRCDVIQIIYSGIPASLQHLLEAPATLKVGLGIHGDVSRLFHDYQISTREFADLSILANKKMKSQTQWIQKQWSLSSLALELTGKQVDKIRSIRCGDWEALPLSEPQLQYAATDAFASLHLYQVLASFPNPESDQTGSNDFNSEPELPTIQIRPQR